MMLATVLTLVTALPQHGGDEVWAILQQHCVRCHGPEKQKGKLRLDTKDGVASVVVAGDPAQSELVRRIRLPRDDDEVMPPEDELPAAAVDALVRWVGDGAPMAAIEAAASRSAATTQLTRERQQALEAATGARLRPVAGAGVAWRLDFGRATGVAPVHPERLTAHAALLADVVELSFAGRSGIDWDALDWPPLPRLERLHVERSSIDDAGLARLLAASPNLQYLNVHSTKVTAASLPTIERLAALRRLVAFGTTIEAAALERFSKARPDVRVSTEAELPLARATRRRVLVHDPARGDVAVLEEQAIGVYDERWRRHAPGVAAVGWLGDQMLLTVGDDGVVALVDAATGHEAGRTAIPPQGAPVLSGGRGDVAAILFDAPPRVLVLRAGVAPDRTTDAVPLPFVATACDVLAAGGFVLGDAQGRVREVRADGAVALDVAVDGAARIDAVVRLHDGRTLAVSGDPLALDLWRADGTHERRLGAADWPGMQLGRAVSLAALPDGHVLVGQRTQATVEPPLFEVDLALGAVVWTFRDAERFPGDVRAVVATPEGSR
jgi:hypothetical protein